jgi:SAM-dependent methyltransferase
MVERAAITQGERILDVGCGPGRLAIVAGSMAGSTGESCGVDPASEMVELARRNAARARVRVRFDVGLIEALPYPDDYFDVVLSSMMLHPLRGPAGRAVKSRWRYDAEDTCASQSARGTTTQGARDGSVSPLAKHCGAAHGGR